MRNYNAFETCNIRFFVNKQVQFTTIQVTTTGLKKSILDATTPVRAFFTENGVHNYDTQMQGQENKRLINTRILTENDILSTQSSLYRPVTKKGDPRIWIYGIKQFVHADDIIAIIAYNRLLYVINLTQINVPAVYNSSSNSPLKDLIINIHRLSTSVSGELLMLIRERMSNWTPTTVLADTGVGREVEFQLGIPMNPNKTPDYKGIELKSKRENSMVRSGLFTQTPNWEISHLKSSREIVEKYGYVPKGYDHKCLHVTLSATKPNPQRLGLNVNYSLDHLEANEYITPPSPNSQFIKVNDVAAWELVELHQRLLTKHHETFWIDVANRIEQGREYFRVTSIEHTKNPITSQFDTLLEQGKITVDFLLSRKSGGDMYSFKIGKKYRPLLFPESEIYTF